MLPVAFLERAVRRFDQAWRSRRARHERRREAYRQASEVACGRLGLRPIKVVLGPSSPRQQCPSPGAASAAWHWAGTNGPDRVPRPSWKRRPSRQIRRKATRETTRSMSQGRSRPKRRPTRHRADERGAVLGPVKPNPGRIRRRSRSHGNVSTRICLSFRFRRVHHLN